MKSADSITVFLCEQIGDRVHAIMTLVPTVPDSQTPRAAADRLLDCSGAASCGWRGPDGGRANPCAHQLALAAMSLQHITSRRVASGG